MPVQAAFTLNPNEIFGSLANMIISQEVFANNLGKHQTLVDKARVDGSLYGDKKLYYATDVLKSEPWGADAEATNLLALHRPKDPEVQDITLDVFRQISLTIDNYLTKRAWSTEGAFSQFNSVMLGWMRETKKVYDGTLYNVFIGTTITNIGGQSQSVDVTTAVGSATGTEASKLEAMAIAQALADLLVAMGDYSRDFNDYGFLRSYADASIKVIWNSKYINKIRKVDLPTIFHKEGLVDKFEEDVLPARYFGTPNDQKLTGISASTVRSMLEKDYTVSNVVTHVFPGDYIPAGADVEIGEGYNEDEKVICKVLVEYPPFMSAFEAGTSFFNAKSLTENHYLTFGHNTLEYLKNYPFITIKAI